MDRQLKSHLIDALDKKIVLLSGPRQTGKTYLSKQLYSSFQYINYDSGVGQKTIRENSWDREKDLIVFDELHKKKHWKNYIKGIFDVEGVRPRLLVTGSARLDIHRKAGDSLAGRHRLMRLMPFSLNEAKLPVTQKSIQTMMTLGTFPEPLLSANERVASIWRKSYLDAILRQDLLDYKTVSDFKAVEIMVQLLSERVGSLVSYSSLARDLEKSPNTMKAWLELLESLYLIFRVSPYSKNIGKSILKEPKFYFFDCGRVEGEAAQLENLVALHLYKYKCYLEDIEGKTVALHYIRNKEKKEVDFLVLINGKPDELIEVKVGEESLSPHLKLFAENIRPRKSTQIVYKLKEPKTLSGIKITSCHDFFAKLPV